MTKNDIHSSEASQGQRIVFIDLAKGFCITQVVLYHVYGQLSGDVINIMTLFRMPLYFVLSGLFFKPYNGFWSFFKKKTNKLLIPFLLCYLFFNLPMAFLIDLKEGTNIPIRSLLSEDGFTPYLSINGAIWFLLCLFIVNILFYLICMISKNIIIRIALSFACGVTGWYLGVSDVSLYAWIDSALTATPFFVMGYIMRHYGTILYNKMSAFDYAIGALCLVLLIGIYYYNKSFNEVYIKYMYNRYDVNILTIYFGGIIGTYFILMLSKAFTHIPVLSYIGRYSVVILITHQAYIFFIRNILYQLSLPQDNAYLNFSIFVFLLLIELPTIKYGIKYLPVCFAQKDLWK